MMISDAWAYEFLTMTPLYLICCIVNSSIGRIIVVELRCHTEY